MNWGARHPARRCARRAGRRDNPPIQVAAPPPRSQRWARAWPALRWILAAAVVGLAAWVVSGQLGELTGAGRLLAHLRWSWAVVAVAVEALSYLASAQLQRVLLWSGGIPAGVGRTTLIGLATSAMQNSLPAGAAFAGVFAYRQYRRMGADEVLAAWSVVAVTGCLFVGLAALAVVGLLLAFGTGSALGLVQVLGGLGAAAALVLLWSRRRWVLARVVGGIRLGQRLTGRPRGDVAAHAQRVATRLLAVTPSRQRWAVALAAATATWVFDLLCLAAGFAAVGADLPWRGLLLAYAAAQLAATLPITPGGLGVVEGSLTVALVAFGGAEVDAVAAVLVYRVVSYWAEIPVGWGASAVAGRLGHRRAPAPQPALEVGEAL